jgi:SAM-dependent methyltransferase
MKYSKKYHLPYLNINNFRLLGRNLFTPKVSVLFDLVGNLVPQSKVIDVGCGTGGLLQVIEQANPNLITYGIELETPPSFLSEGTFLHGNLLNLPFKDNSFDLVLCSHVIEHLLDPFSAIQELRRICRTHGHIYIETPSHRSLLMPIGVNFWDDPTHVRPYTRHSLRKLFELNEIGIVKDGVKKSLPGIIFGLPYIFIGKLLKDPLARVIFPIYAFGLSVYILGKKQ